MAENSFSIKTTHVSGPIGQDPHDSNFKSILPSRRLALPDLSLLYSPSHASSEALSKPHSETAVQFLQIVTSLNAIQVAGALCALSVTISRVLYHAQMRMWCCMVAFISFPIQMVVSFPMVTTNDPMSNWYMFNSTLLSSLQKIRTRKLVLGWYLRRWKATILEFSARLIKNGSIILKYFPVKFLTFLTTASRLFWIKMFGVYKKKLIIHRIIMFFLIKKYCSYLNRSLFLLILQDRLQTLAVLAVGILTATQLTAIALIKRTLSNMSFEANVV